MADTSTGNATILSRRRSPAADLTDEMAAGSSPELSLREVPFLAQIGLRAAPGSDSARALEGVLGLALPAASGEITGSGDRHVLWLGPDEFLLIAPDEADGGPVPQALADELAAALEGLPGQVVDLSANRTTLELRGASAQHVLDKSCRLDLHPRAFAIGTAKVALLETTSVILWRIEDEAWRILPRASFSPHVGRWLLDGMREFVS
ncbi:MAG: sarcosine oxidase subunit gamma family protein [Micrococcales bacterium]|nr:sarcosine oxidase subunit gamma family protein [Micrococcales bacterium]